ncbi:TPA: Fur-regulated protein [Citrobacter koseri]|nr:Fur-regulated protein [Citrobacter koseri]
MSQKIITLSGAATDVLYALFYRGALQSGDLPSKSGASELRELGFAETRHTATQYQKENYFTFLTTEGQAFAVEHLVNTRFGKERQQEYCCAMGIEIDTSNFKNIIDEIDDSLRNYDGFKIDRSGQVFINNAFIGDVIHAADPEDTRSATNIYNISLGIRRDDTVHFAGIGVDTNLEALIENAVKNTAKDVAKKVADDQKTMDDLTSFIRKAIRNECRPGGAIWGIRRRGI